MKDLEKRVQEVVFDVEVQYCDPSDCYHDCYGEGVNNYRTMRAELQSNIRNPLSCIKTSCFLINSLAEKENIQSEKLREYLQIMEKAAEDIESALK